MEQDLPHDGLAILHCGPRAILRIADQFTVVIQNNSENTQITIFVDAIAASLCAEIALGGFGGRMQ
ncbi:hypothetical protein UL82_01375 [Corynebacterium kutscheri]|uniref:Uncharacterized protein n=1 Tax=Corynebacterium kutscheri TaxID=35755 RepID=A0A0F6QYD7_9CORY|nr:hypothetical protein UL82_01375 [Corynebacterium kutscheri]VEH05065.1 Uncharacterised protein [Corynebacterium kutscheri]VEH10902.1 Uncharacterised protein [Corynebacterium kutscheri]